MRYELKRTYVAGVAEVEVNRQTGAVRVPRFFVVQDCGQIINPDGVRNQLDGNVIQTVSRVLMEEVAFNRSAVTSFDWASYPILTFPDVPEVIIDLIDRPTEKPGAPASLPRRSCLRRSPTRSSTRRVHGCARCHSRPRR